MPRAILYSFAPMTRPEGPTREQQHAQNQAYADQIGATIVGEFHDLHGGESSDLVRPELKKVVAILEAGLADCVICYNQDILSPNSGRTRRIKRFGELLYSTSSTSNPDATAQR